MHEALLSSGVSKGAGGGEGIQVMSGLIGCLSLSVANSLGLGSGVPDKLLQQGIEGPAESRGDPVSAVHVSHRGCCHPCHCQPLGTQRAGEAISSGRADDPSRATPPAARSGMPGCSLPVWSSSVLLVMKCQGKAHCRLLGVHDLKLLVFDLH